MTWVVVSFINVIEVLEGEQSEFPVEEEFCLFEVHSNEELDKKISEQISLINSAGAEGIRYCEKPAKEYCMGVRKVKSIFNSTDGLDIDKDPPSDNTTLTSSYMTVTSLDDVKRLAEGKAVHVYYIDDDELEN